jgi:hypothetical protein
MNWHHRWFEQGGKDRNPEHATCSHWLTELMYCSSSLFVLQLHASGEMLLASRSARSEYAGNKKEINCNQWIHTLKIHKLFINLKKEFYIFLRFNILYRILLPTTKWNSLSELLWDVRYNKVPISSGTSLYTQTIRKWFEHYWWILIMR